MGTSHQTRTHTRQTHTQVPVQVCKPVLCTQGLLTVVTDCLTVYRGFVRRSSVGHLA